MEGTLNLVSPDTVGYVLSLANGVSASLTGVVVTADSADFPGTLHIQAAPGSGYFGGVRVTGSFPNV